jgi:hypothetical protein
MVGKMKTERGCNEPIWVPKEVLINMKRPQMVWIPKATSSGTWEASHKEYEMVQS